MAVYVDDARNPHGRMVMCHMLADTLDELHAMAEAIGMRRSWYQPVSFPHYDLSRARRAHAIGMGAVEVDRRGIVAVKRRLRDDPRFRLSVESHHATNGLALPRFLTVCAERDE